MAYHIYIKEIGRAWRRLPGPFGTWESLEAAKRHADSIAPGYFAMTVEDDTGAVVYRPHC